MLAKEQLDTYTHCPLSLTLTIAVFSIPLENTLLCVVRQPRLSLSHNVVILRHQPVVDVVNILNHVARCHPNAALVLMVLLDIVERLIKLLDGETGNTSTRCEEATRVDDGGIWPVGGNELTTSSSSVSVLVILEWTVEEGEADEGNRKDNEDKKTIQGEGVVVLAAERLVACVGDVSGSWGHLVGSFVGVGRVVDLGSRKESHMSLVGGRWCRLGILSGFAGGHRC